MLAPKRLVQRIFAAALCALIWSCGVGASERGAWIASWTAGLHAGDADPKEPLLNIDRQTVRQRVRLSLGGERIRLSLSNEFGSTPLTIGAVSVALASDAAGINPETLRVLKFSGRESVTIPAGAPAVSDPVDLVVPPGAEIAVSLYFPGRATTPTLHGLALKRTIVSARGDFTTAGSIEAQAISESFVALGAVLVPRRAGQRLVVAFGDSITDGDGSTLDADGAWPSALSRRLNARRGGAQIAVVNQGIAGNRLLRDGFGIKALGVSALARFDRDVLAVPGVTHVVLSEGLNDLGFAGATLGGRPLAGPDETFQAQDLIDAYRQLIERAHAHGVKIIAATLTPFEGIAGVPGYYSPAKEQARQRVNAWIRGSEAVDGVIDFDAVLRDPANPRRLQARYASSDGLHPNDAGYRAMADAIDVALFDEPRSAAADGRVFELNIYHANAGKGPALVSRFREASQLQTRHGLNVIGYWVPHGEPAWKDTFVYLLAHSSRAAADKHWRAFHADPQFQKYLQAEAAEPLISSVDTVFMSATDYSLMQ